MKALTAVLTAIALLAPVAANAADFEGTVTMAMTGSPEQAVPMTFSIKPGFTRMDSQGPNGQAASVIMDSAKRELTILMPEQKMYMVQPMPNPAANSQESAPESNQDVTVEKTGEHEKILGYDTTKYVAKTKDGTTELWVTDQLGVFTGFGAGRPMGGRGPFGARRRPSGGGQAQQAWEQAFKGTQAFPLRVVNTNKDGKTSKMEVTAIDKKTLPDSLFQPPADFKKFDLGSMMQGMGLPGGMHMPGGN